MDVVRLVEEKVLSVKEKVLEVLRSLDGFYQID